MADPENSDDLFFLRENPLVAVEDEFGPSFFILLQNFDLNSKLLRAMHVEVLRERVVPFILRRVGFAEIYAMTDRSGSRKINYQVAGQRLAEVQRNLLLLSAPQAKVIHPFAKAIGEDFFEHRHLDDNEGFFADGIKKASLRSVAIALSPAPIGIPTRMFRARVAREVISFGRVHVQKP